LENTGLKVLALLITAVLWLSVASRPVSQVPIPNVPIEFLNLNQMPNLTVSKYDTLSARVLVEGPRDILDSLRPAQLSVAADMLNVEPGVRVIPLKVDPTRLPASVKVRDIEPRSIRVTVERVIQKYVPVKPRFEGQPAAGFELVNWQLTPNSVQIAGAESLVRDVTEVSTETVRLNERTESFSEMVAIDIGSPNLWISDESGRRVMLQVNIGELTVDRVIDRVPVSLINAPRGATPSPEFLRVTLTGPRSSVNSMGPADVIATVDCKGEAARGRRFTPEIAVSPAFEGHVTVRHHEPSTVTVK